MRELEHHVTASAGFGPGKVGVGFLQFAHHGRGWRTKQTLEPRRADARRSQFDSNPLLLIIDQVKRPGVMGVTGEPDVIAPRSIPVRTKQASPDGRNLAYVVDPPAAWNSQLWMTESPDGQSFVFIEAEDPTEPTQRDPRLSELVLIENWQERLRDAPDA